MKRIEERLSEIEDRIRRAAERSGRARAQVTLLAVSKKQPLDAMRALQSALAARGAAACFGENYVQEFMKKREALAQPFEAHLIGPLQRNKAKDAVRCFDVVQSVHDEKIAAALDEAARAAARVIPVYLQVNVSSDDAKSGVDAAHVPDLASFVRERCGALRLTGLMTITRLYEEAEEARPDFARLRAIRDAIPEGAGLKLSMGMSGDFEVAIEEGSDIVRIGTALFGSRLI